LTVFSDSSALVKLYADETDAEVVRRVPVHVVSAVARVEVPAALWRKSRTGDLSVEDASVLVAAFVADWHDAAGPFVPVGLRTRVLEQAASSAATHGLRAYDAVQLACALAARAAGAQVDGFLCFDGDLRAAAGREGFVLVA
jgi:predicted nucleic acid-binding protein